MRTHRRQSCRQENSLQSLDDTGNCHRHRPHTCHISLRNRVDCHNLRAKHHDRYASLVKRKPASVTDVTRWLHSVTVHRILKFLAHYVSRITHSTLAHDANVWRVRTALGSVNDPFCQLIVGGARGHATEQFAPILGINYGIQTVKQ
jgi:hypothetical protein